MYATIKYEFGIAAEIHFARGIIVQERIYLHPQETSATS